MKMRTLTRIITLTLIMAIATLMSCTKSPKQMLTGEFKISSISTDLKMTPEEQSAWNEAMEDLKKSTKLVLEANGNMQETTNGITEKGTWEVFGDNGEEGEGWRLMLTKESKSTVSMEIQELTDNGFVYTMKDEASHSKMVITYTKTK
ncbi:MAG: hypothetical protein J6X05_07730 [Bacteroidales bacterium]|nr:hypothetical protein [Bacteroidales bacterium]